MAKENEKEKKENVHDDGRLFDPFHMTLPLVRHCPVFSSDSWSLSFYRDPCHAHGRVARRGGSTFQIINLFNMSCADDWTKFENVSTIWLLDWIDKKGEFYKNGYLIASQLDKYRDRNCRTRVRLLVRWPRSLLGDNTYSTQPARLLVLDWFRLIGHSIRIESLPVWW